MNSENVFKMVERARKRLIFIQQEINHAKYKIKKYGEFIDDNALDLTLLQEKSIAMAVVKVGLEKFAKKLKYEEQEGFVREEIAVINSIKFWVEEKILYAQKRFEIAKFDNHELGGYEDCGDFYQEKIMIEEVRLQCFQSAKGFVH